MSGYIDCDDNKDVLAEYEAVFEGPERELDLTLALSENKEDLVIVEDIGLERQNVCSGDILLSVNGVKVDGSNLAQINRLLRAPCTLKVTALSDWEAAKLGQVKAELPETFSKPTGGDSGNEGEDERSQAEENKLKETTKDEEKPQEKAKVSPKKKKERKRNPVLDEPRQEFYDVLDDTPIEKTNKNTEKMIIRRGKIPPAPKGGWTWRKAKLVDEMEEDDDIVWKFEYADGEGSITVSMLGNIFFVAPVDSKTSLEMHHKYEVGDIDCLDFFTSKKDGRRKKKWREAEVVAVEPYWVRVHFKTWSSLWDEWIHVYQGGYRLAPFEQETKRAERERRAREKNFKESMEKDHKLTVLRMDADGNCLFRTVAHQVYGNPMKHKLVRKECCNFILKNKPRFEMYCGNVARYVRRMKKLGEWGDDPEIRAMEELYDRPMEMYQCRGNGSDTKPMQIHFVGDLPEKGLEDVEPIRLSYHGRCHYNSVVPLELISQMKNETLVWKAPVRRKEMVIYEHRQKMVQDALDAEKKRVEEAKKKKEEETEENEEEKKEEGSDKKDGGETETETDTNEETEDDGVLAGDEAESDD
mmetsp:Transcript_15040/g.17024  ORF Transcript_15040/g.17024 Transcript_15040/m.17024 type:complete len:584 (-) Transcript_15040:173-1924(-)|eukprot:CAMPEP_0184027742 /NCGR_PEP_ID=MMETSP0954-20121128/14382_1 /TAXON_ID=627963 /ORGANISM="Aplanochytrium sp, Strain PBS07" /LENGTH=583 /DNA_ID=CAMNT_0026312365 /DNA_START=254 /DNA_END=2005 /DNA_ORIENTATION=-